MHELPATYPSLAASGSMAAPVRWGILGCGDVCEVKSGPALQRASGSELVAVMRRTPGAAKDFAERHGVPKWFEDAKALVDCEDVTAVYVASTPAAHYEHAKLAAEVRAPSAHPTPLTAMSDRGAWCTQAGKPCYMEKPIGRNVAESEAIVALFEDAGVPLFVAYYRRGLAPFIQVRRSNPWHPRAENQADC